MTINCTDAFFLSIFHNRDNFKVSYVLEIQGSPRRAQGGPRKAQRGPAAEFLQIFGHVCFLSVSHPAHPGREIQIFQILAFSTLSKIGGFLLGRDKVDKQNPNKVVGRDGPSRDSSTKSLIFLPDLLGLAIFEENCCIDTIFQQSANTKIRRPAMFEKKCDLDTIFRQFPPSATSALEEEKLS